VIRQALRTQSISANLIAALTADCLEGPQQIRSGPSAVEPNSNVRQTGFDYRDVIASMTALWQELHTTGLCPALRIHQPHVLG
jgi:hypothetical protein